MPSKGIPVENRNSNIRNAVVHVCDNNQLLSREETFISECVTRISINNKVVEILPAVNGNIDLLGMGYLYQITELSSDELNKGEATGSDFNLHVEGSDDCGCMCKKIFFVKKKTRQLTGDLLPINKDLVFSVFSDFNHASENF